MNFLHLTPIFGGPDTVPCKHDLIVGVNVSLNSHGKFTPIPALPEIRTYFRCYYCGDDLTDTIIHKDHVIPRSRNGSHSQENRVQSCQHCNLQKKDMTLEEYRQYLQRINCAPVRFYGEAHA